MIARYPLSLLLCAALTCHALTAAPATPEQIQRFTQSRPELDEITWKDPARGAPVAVRIIQSNNQTVTIEKTLATGLTVRNIPLSDLSGISFKFTPAEASLHRKPKITSIPALRLLWQLRQSTLRLTGSNAGESGLLLAQSLRLGAEDTTLREALKIVAQIRSHETSKPRLERVLAEQLTLEFLLSQKSSNVTESDRLAWEITAGPENPEGMLLATAFLGERHFADLKATEEEHPRWMDDEEIRPLRQRLYQLTLDFFLYPSLFLGTREDEAAHGLKRAADVYQFTGSTELMQATLADLAALYPESPAAQEADAKPVQSESQPPPETPVETPPTTPPPPPERYNIFDE